MMTSVTKNAGLRIRETGEGTREGGPDAPRVRGFDLRLGCRIGRAEGGFRASSPRFRALFLGALLQRFVRGAAPGIAGFLDAPQRGIDRLLRAFALARVGMRWMTPRMTSNGSTNWSSCHAWPRSCLSWHFAAKSARCFPLSSTNCISLARSDRRRSAF